VDGEPAGIGPESRRRAGDGNHRRRSTPQHRSLASYRDVEPLLRRVARLAACSSVCAKGGIKPGAKHTCRANQRKKGGRRLSAVVLRSLTDLTAPRIKPDGGKENSSSPVHLTTGKVNRASLAHGEGYHLFAQNGG
jgi:hypothetical protein